MRLRTIRLAILLVPVCVAPAAAQSNETMPPAARALLDYELQATQIRTRAADLDGDGTPDFLIYDESPDRCGTGGCTLHLITCRSGACRVRLSEPTVRLPIRLLDTRTEGWRDLAVVRAGGGYSTRVERLRLGRMGEEGDGDSELEPNERSGTVLIGERAATPR